MSRSDADRDVWSEMQRDGAPSFEILSDKTVTARKPHELDCGCFIHAYPVDTHRCFC